MWRNRIFYLLALLGATVFFAFFYAWFSEYLWWLTVLLPVLSLVMSLPAMLLTKPRLDAPRYALRGSTAAVTVTTLCPLPQPRCRFRLTGRSLLAGSEVSARLAPGSLQLTRELPTQHCGTLVCKTRRVWISDYLGLISIPRFWKASARVTVLPVAAAPKRMPTVTQLLSPSARPKPGGGFSEMYELRDYRPGDSLRQIHWKLTAKNDSPVVREPQEATRGPVVLTFDLLGAPEELDAVMDKTLYLSQWLISQNYPHQVRWYSGREPVTFPVGNTDDCGRLAIAMAESSPALLTQAPTIPGAAWHYHVKPDC